MSEIIDLLFSDVLAPLIVAGIVGGVGWLSTIAHCVHRQNKRGWRQSQAIALLAEHLQEESVRLHPKDPPSGDISHKVDRILRDEKGRF